MTDWKQICATSYFYLIIFVIILQIQQYIILLIFVELYRMIHNKKYLYSFCWSISHKLEFIDSILCSVKSTGKKIWVPIVLRCLPVLKNFEEATIIVRSLFGASLAAERFKDSIIRTFWEKCKMSDEISDKMSVDKTGKK